MANRPNILIVADAADGKLHFSTLELLTLGQRLKAQTGGELVVALVEQGAGAAATALAECGADTIHRMPCTDLAMLSVESRLAALQSVCEQVQPRIVLVAHGVIGAELGPRLAFRIGAGASTGCVDVEVDGEAVRSTRPCYGGIAREVNEFDAAPVVATIRAGMFELAQPQAGRTAKCIDVSAPDAASARVKLIERKTESGEGPRLEDARIIVAGGRGLEGPAGFEVLQLLATELGAAVGASRVPCDLGWCPHSMQIGLTGKTVTPDLYIAVGISGAGHHMAGCGNAKTIVAINSDPEAAIFQDARFGVIGDYREVVPALAAQVRALKQA